MWTITKFSAEMPHLNPGNKPSETLLDINESAKILSVENDPSDWHIFFRVLEDGGSRSSGSGNEPMRSVFVYNSRYPRINEPIESLRYIGHAIYRPEGREFYFFEKIA